MRLLNCLRSNKIRIDLGIVPRSNTETNWRNLNDFSNERTFRDHRTEKQCKGINERKLSVPIRKKMKGKKPYRAHAMNTDCTYQYEQWLGNRTQLSICYIVLNYYKIY